MTATLDSPPDAGHDSGTCSFTAAVFGTLEQTRTNLQRAGIDIVPAAASSPPDAVIISTRTPRGKIAEILSGSHGRPVIVLVHPGGEHAAAELGRLGARCAIAEGNEAAARAFLETGQLPGGDLLGLYLRSQGDATSRAVEQSSWASFGSLADEEAFTAHLQQLEESRRIPRIWSLTVGNLDRRAAMLADSAGPLLRRRVHLLLEQTASQRDAVVYQLDSERFTVVADEPGDPDTGASFAHALSEALAGFSDRRLPAVTPTIGYAGPESADQATSVFEIADRTRRYALGLGDRSIHDAADLSRNLASATELTVILRLLEGTDGEHIAGFAAQLAADRELDAEEQAVARLVAHCVPLGSIIGGAAGSADGQQAAGNGDSDKHGELPQQTDRHVRATHSWPQLLADWLRPVAGAAAADAAAQVLERWDGTGTPGQRSRYQISYPARVAACAMEVRAAQRAGDDPAQRVRSLAGTRLDPDLARAALQLLASS